MFFITFVIPVLKTKHIGLYRDKPIYVFKISAKFWNPIAKAYDSHKCTVCDNHDIVITSDFCSSKSLKCLWPYFCWPS